MPEEQGASGQHSGHRQRMRERFLKQGLDGFAPHEVLELILFFAIPQRNVNPVAHALLERFGSLHGVLEANQQELTRVEGVGEYAATLLGLFREVSRRLAKSGDAGRVTLQNRTAAEKYCVNLLSGLKQEYFYAVCLNAQMQVLADALITRGSLSEVHAYPRLVADAVLRYNAHSVVLCHNHPGGSPMPSRSDIETTNALNKLLSGIETRLADHIIVADGQAYSMVGGGLIEQTLTKDVLTTKVADPGGGQLIRAQIERTVRVRNR